MSQCIGKKRFPDEDTALRALDTIRDNADAWLRDKVPKRVYSCDVCLGWHLTSAGRDTRKKSRHLYF